MARAISKKPFEYILERERTLPQAEQTVWILARLTAQDREEIGELLRLRSGRFRQTVGESGETDRQVDGVMMGPNRTAVTNATLRAGLRGWRNFRDETGTEVRYEAPDATGRCAWGNIDAIEEADAVELANAIDEGAQISEDDRKNSPSPAGCAPTT